MQTRTHPKVFCKKEIKNIYSKPKREWEIIGRINLVSYLRGDDIPHLEFKIFDEFENWKNKGIMSKELPKYLKWCKQYHPRLIAVVRKDNIISIKLLEKNNFIRAAEFSDAFGFMIDLNFTKEKLAKMHHLVENYFGESRF